MIQRRPSEQVDAVVVGAGVVGLAVARALAQAGLETVVLEREARVGSGISSRNSGVIHAGIYYPPGSAKARLCVRGRELLYAYAARRGIAHRRCGKLIVASQASEISALEALAARARANGVEGLELIDGGQARCMEPALHCAAALHSPHTGIIDSHELVQALLGEASEAGAMVALRTPVLAIDPGPPHRVRTPQIDLVAPRVVNAAGLGAHLLVQPPVAMHWAKGQYFEYAGRSPFSRLIYPLPEPGGLGIHATLDTAGRLRFGPDVVWVDAPEYAVDPAARPRFAEAIRRWFPQIREQQLQPGYAGVRPKLGGPGQATDFRVHGPQDHGHAGLVHLLGIESPGLTAALAIAEHLLALLDAG